MLKLDYLEVVDVFATYITDKDKEPEYSINAEALNYQFWQLIEMTSLTYQERLKVQPNWTRAEIRAYKKSLKEKSIGKTVQPAEPVAVEEKPMSEAQQRFAKYSKDDLIKRRARKARSHLRSSCTVPVNLNSRCPKRKSLLRLLRKILNLITMRYTCTDVSRA